MISLNDFIWDVVSGGPHEIRLQIRCAPGLSEKVARLLTHHGAPASARTPCCVQVLNAAAQRATLELLGVLRGAVRAAFEEWEALRATKPVCWERVGALKQHILTQFGGQGWGGALASSDD